MDLNRSSCILAALLLMMNPRFSHAAVKEPSAAGQFYPGDPKELSKVLEAFFKNLPEIPAKPVELLIAPHAGYPYSGFVAAHSFAAASHRTYHTIVLIGPSHFVDFKGVSVWKEGSFKTPLGEIPIDGDFALHLLKHNKDASFNQEAFSREHSLEVELPFLQKTFKNFKIVPILMGQPDYEVCQRLAAQLNELIGNREDVLVVVSTDMSHYHQAPIAQVMDAKTLFAIKNLVPKDLWNQCLTGDMELCGFTSVVTGLLFAKERGLTEVDILKYAHSGMVSGDNNRVVGYSSIIFSRPPNVVTGFPRPSSFSPDEKKRLIDIAKDTLKYYLATGKTLEVTENNPRLLKEEGAFVTLTKQGHLRGCIGHIIGDQPLYLTVRDMTIAAASQDPRFPPVEDKEFKDIEIEISVLSVPRPIRDVKEIKLGEHGVILGKGNKRGLFLPQVAAETGWDHEKFLSELCSQKAGLSPDCWRDPNVEILIFSADVFK